MHVGLTPRRSPHSRPELPLADLHFACRGDTLTVGKITFQIDLGDGAPVALPGTEDDVVNIEPEESDSTVHSESAVLQYQATGEGSVIGVVEEEVEVVDDDDDGLGDFLKSLK